MNSSIIKFFNQIKKPSTTRWRRIGWFIALYGAALGGMGIVMLLLHGLVAALIAL